MPGWWGELPTAEQKFRSWIGSYSSAGSAAVVLAKCAAEDELVVVRWPGEADQAGRKATSGSRIRILPKS